MPASTDKPNYIQVSFDKTNPEEVHFEFMASMRVHLLVNNVAVIEGTVIEGVVLSYTIKEGEEVYISTENKDGGGGVHTGFRRKNRLRWEGDLDSSWLE